MRGALEGGGNGLVEGVGGRGVNGDNLGVREDE